MVRDERLSMFAIFEGEIVTVCTVPVSPLSVHGKRPFKYLRCDQSKVDYCKCRSSQTLFHRLWFELVSIIVELINSNTHLGFFISILLIIHSFYIFFLSIIFYSYTWQTLRWRQLWSGKGTKTASSWLWYSRNGPWCVRKIYTWCLPHTKHLQVWNIAIWPWRCFWSDSSDI